MADKSGFVDRGTLGKGDDVCTPYMDISAIVQTQANPPIVYNDNPFVDINNGMQVTLLDLAMCSASSVEFLGARSS